MKEKQDLLYRILEGAASATLALLVGFFMWSLMFYYKVASYLPFENDDQMGKVIVIGAWALAHIFFVQLVAMGARERNPHRHPTKTENDVLLVSSIVPIMCLGWLFKDLGIMKLYGIMLVITCIGSPIGVVLGNRTDS